MPRDGRLDWAAAEAQIDEAVQRLWESPTEGPIGWGEERDRLGIGGLPLEEQFARLLPFGVEILGDDLAGLRRAIEDGHPELGRVDVNNVTLFVTAVDTNLGGLDACEAYAMISSLGTADLLKPIGFTNASFP